MRKTLLLSIVCLMCFHPVDAKNRSQAPTRYSQIKVKRLTGTYRNRSSEFKVQALGINRLHIQFNGTYEYKVGRELMANTGTADGMTRLNGNVAIFVPPETQGCSITLTFIGNKLIVKQTGSDADCGFGHKVVADGTYIKRSSRPPIFETP